MQLKKFRMYPLYVLLLSFVWKIGSCQKVPAGNTELFEPVPTRKELLPQTIFESSGIADSRINQGYIWVQEDSGNPPRLFLTGHDGKVLKSVFISHATNRDWEDMALGKGPDPALDYIYIGDFGDNGSKYEEYMIYRFPEPSLTVDTVRNVSKIRYRYPDGSHDTEAMIVDPVSGDIYLITKRDTKSGVYRLRADYSMSGLNTAEFVVSLPYNGVVSAAVSPDRRAVLVKTYSAVNHYRIDETQPMSAVFETRPVAVTYEVEPQGEAITFANDNSGFFTLSEKGFAQTIRLYFYKRK